MGVCIQWCHFSLVLISTGIDTTPVYLHHHHCCISICCRPLGGQKATVNWCDIPAKHMRTVLAPPTTQNPLKYVLAFVLVLINLYITSTSLCFLYAAHRHVVFVHNKSPLAAQTPVSASTALCSEAPAEHPLLPARWMGNHNAVHVNA